MDLQIQVAQIHAANRGPAWICGFRSNRSSQIKGRDLQIHRSNRSTRLGESLDSPAPGEHMGALALHALCAYSKGAQSCAPSGLAVAQAHQAVA